MPLSQIDSLEHLSTAVTPNLSYPNSQYSKPTSEHTGRLGRSKSQLLGATNLDVYSRLFEQTCQRANLVVLIDVWANKNALNRQLLVQSFEKSYVGNDRSAIAFTKTDFLRFSLVAIGCHGRSIAKGGDAIFAFLGKSGIL